jgi:hypothetical protein
MNGCEGFYFICNIMPKDGHEQACLWISFVLPFLLKLSLFYWSVLVIIGICLFWILHLLLHLIRLLPEEGYG